MQRIADELRAKGRKPWRFRSAHRCLWALSDSFTRRMKSRRWHALRRDLSFQFLRRNASGLDAGLQLYGQERVQLVGVSADDPAASIASNVAEIVAGVADLLGVDRAALSDRSKSTINSSVKATESRRRRAGSVRLLARTEGIVLDPVYTAKPWRP
jgi:hypothetical protein